MVERGFGSAEFKVVCSPKKVELFIHGKHLVAKSNKDVYEKLFNFCVKNLGGRIDGV